MLHLTNGDSAVPELRAAGIDDEILPWREVLHDGPVPGGLAVDELRAVRASFLDAADAPLELEPIAAGTPALRAVGIAFHRRGAHHGTGIPRLNA